MSNPAVKRAKERAKGSSARAAKRAKEPQAPPALPVNQTWSVYQRTLVAWLETLHRDFIELGEKLDELKELLKE